MPYLSIDASQRIYYEHTAGENSTVVLAHGWGMSGRVRNAARRRAGTHHAALLRCIARRRVARR